MTIEYTFTMKENFEDDDLAGMPNRFIQTTLVGHEDKTWDELLPFFMGWMKAVGYHLDGKKLVMVDADE